MWTRCGSRYRTASGSDRPGYAGVPPACVSCAHPILGRRDACVPNGPGATARGSVTNVSQITRAFDALKREGRKGFIPFITAGDPDLETTRELIVELARVGATIIELGVPFSDPMADGPVIQRASERALRHGFGLDEVLKVVTAARTQTEVPIILFSYFNPLLQWCQKPDRKGGPALLKDAPAINDALPDGRASDTSIFDFEQLARAARKAGVDGIL